MIIRVIGILLLSLASVACDPYLGEAPVRNVGTFTVGSITYYRVNRGETLYSVAWQFNQDYRTLAALNRLHPPYRLHTGEVLQLTPGSKQQEATRGIYFTPFIKRIEKPSEPKTTYSPTSKSTPSPTQPSYQPSPHWVWPTQGKIIQYYSPYHKGIDIAGHLEQSIVAAAPGEVVYAGNGIRGYGNMIIIKHSNEFLSAYAYNQRILVEAGDIVMRGQIIAAMGMSSHGKSKEQQPCLHFEVRDAGRPVDPLRLLKK